MAGKYEAPRKKFPWGIWAVLVLAVLGIFLIGRGMRKTEKPEFTGPTAVTETSEQKMTETVTEPEEPFTVSRAVLSVQGDLLMHATFFQERYQPVCNLGEGNYDFSSLFRYVSEYVAQADYAAANLETTLGGPDFPYQGNPSFNCPDQILDAVTQAGYDLLLTANNHSYDTLMTGINRTLQQVREKGMDTLGTRLSQEESRFQIKDINGIKIGMVCYTYTMTMNGGKPQLNDNSPVKEPEQINYFSYNHLNGFYSEMQEIMTQMKQQGAEATVLFIHWGTEYEVTENATQRAIAQKMCDLGFDVIVGGHPHVVQPMALLSSTQDTEHKTVCIYSLGNAVSNQRRELMRLKTGHTEDGVMLTVTFEKDSEGRVTLADADVLPTWVNLFQRSDGKKEYNILPLDMEQQPKWMEQFGVSETTAAEMLNSYNRTMAIVGSGLNQCREYLNGNP